MKAKAVGRILLLGVLPVAAGLLVLVIAWLAGMFTRKIPPGGPITTFRFTEEFNVQHLRRNTVDQASQVCITIIQRLYSMLKGEEEFDEDRKPYVPLDRILDAVAKGMAGTDVVSTLAARLARLDREISREQQQEITAQAGGKSLATLCRDLLDSINEDDFEYAPFSQFGGLGKAYELFGDTLPEMLEELNARLAA